MDIVNYGLREKYDQLKRFGDRLADMKDIIDWECLKSSLTGLYSNDTENGGRSNYDPILMVKSHGDGTPLEYQVHQLP